jgi:hypothetical protein
LDPAGGGSELELWTEPPPDLPAFLSRAGEGALKKRLLSKGSSLF